MHDKIPELNPEFEMVCSVLESVAKAYPEDSKEAEAIQEAAEAYVFLQLHLQLRSSYEAFRQAGLTGLTEEQKQHLRDMGIQPVED